MSSNHEDFYLSVGRGDVVKIVVGTLLCHFLFSFLSRNYPLENLQTKIADVYASFLSVRTLPKERRAYDRWGRAECAIGKRSSKDCAKNIYKLFQYIIK